MFQTDRTIRVRGRECCGGRYAWDECASTTSSHLWPLLPSSIEDLRQELCQGAWLRENRQYGGDRRQRPTGCGPRTPQPGTGGYMEILMPMFK